MISRKDLILRGIVITPSVGVVMILNSIGKDPPFGEGFVLLLWVGAMFLTSVVMGLIEWIQGRKGSTTLGVGVAFVFGLMAGVIGSQYVLAAWASAAASA
jgi:hypothetical protein